MSSDPVCRREAASPRIPTWVRQRGVQTSTSLVGGESLQFKTTERTKWRTCKPAGRRDAWITNLVSRPSRAPVACSTNRFARLNFVKTCLSHWCSSSVVDHFHKIPVGDKDADKDADSSATASIFLTRFCIFATSAYINEYTATLWG